MVKATVTLMVMTTPTHPFLQSAGQIDHRDIGDGNAESHSGQLAVECRDDFTDGLSGSSGRWDDVSTGSATTTPVLAANDRNDNVNDNDNLYWWVPQMCTEY